MRSHLRCAHYISSNLDGSEDDQITCIKHGPCQSLLPRLQAFHQEEEETDPFECTTVSEEEMAQEYVAHLILDEDDEDESEREWPFLAQSFFLIGVQNPINFAN